MVRNGLEPWHLLIVAIVIIVLFGSKRLPDAARSVGKSLRILKSEARAMKGEDATHPAPSGRAPSGRAPSGRAPSGRAPSGTAGDDAGR
ncbi:Sec-independent protein translocase subunit TatA [Streptomyces sp. NPDC059892]|uniref:Sec-independent protein translocase subunit TatA n=1 Tax=Streptomyces sp. NPDC059892 TaxID=3346989 RepID=UPI003657E4DC